MASSWETRHHLANPIIISSFVIVRCCFEVARALMDSVRFRSLASNSAFERYTFRSFSSTSFQAITLRIAAHAPLNV
jgi:hypothetical protein